jgi:16S rRNA (cytosine1402-N4)-methyltransferase
VTADDAEVAANPRARSARLRAAERTEAPPVASAEMARDLPALSDIVRAR